LSSKPTLTLQLDLPTRAALRRACVGVQEAPQPLLGAFGQNAAGVSFEPLEEAALGIEFVLCTESFVALPKESLDTLQGDLTAACDAASEAISQEPIYFQRFETFQPDRTILVATFRAPEAMKAFRKTVWRLFRAAGVAYPDGMWMPHVKLGRIKGLHRGHLEKLDLSDLALLAPQQATWPSALHLKGAGGERGLPAGGWRPEVFSFPTPSKPAPMLPAAVRATATPNRKEAKSPNSAPGGIQDPNTAASRKAAPTTPTEVSGATNNNSSASADTGGNDNGQPVSSAKVGFQFPAISLDMVPLLVVAPPQRPASTPSREVASSSPASPQVVQPEPPLLSGSSPASSAHSPKPQQPLQPIQPMQPMRESQSPGPAPPCMQPQPPSTSPGLHPPAPAALSRSEVSGLAAADQPALRCPAPQSNPRPHRQPLPEAQGQQQQQQHHPQATCPTWDWIPVSPIEAPKPPSIGSGAGSGAPRRPVPRGLASSAAAPPAPRLGGGGGPGVPGGPGGPGGGVVMGP